MFKSYTNKYSNLEPLGEGKLQLHKWDTLKVFLLFDDPEPLKKSKI